MIKRNDKPKRDAKCAFCEQKAQPEFTNPAQLRPYLTERGKVVSRSRSGVCLAHQRHLSAAVKRARFMALLPYVTMAR